MSDRPTPETDAETMRDEYDHVDSDLGPFAPSDTVTAEFARKLERQRDEAIEKAERYRIEANAMRSKLSLKQQTLTIAEGTLSDLRKQRDGWSAMCSRYKQERDEAREDLEFRRGLYRVQEECLENARAQVKELIYIAGRAIDLAEIDFENDKFGVVSELRDGLEKIKEEKK